MSRNYFAFPNNYFPEAAFPTHYWPGTAISTIPGRRYRTMLPIKISYRYGIRRY